MAREKITNRVVQTATPGEHWDTDLIGFKLIVTRAGHKTFAIEGRLHGRKVKHSFARAGTITLDQARKRAKELLFEIVQGRDPAATAALARKAWTVKELIAEYKEAHFPNLRTSTRNSYDNYFARFIIPHLGKRKVAEVESVDALRLFRSVESECRKTETGVLVSTGKTTANRVIATASSLFGEAIRLGLRTDNPCKSVKRNPESRRERFLSETESARLLRVCDETPHIVTANLIRLLIFTGARKGESLAAKWSEFDLQAGVWTKPSHHTKQKRTHSVPISPAALALLREMWAEAEASGQVEWLFPGGIKGKGLVSPKRAVRTIFRRAGLGSDVCLHTLRHSFAARVVSAGHGLHATGRLLGHTQAATTHRYAHLEHDIQRRALKDVDAAILRGHETSVVSCPHANGRSAKSVEFLVD